MTDKSMPIEVLDARSYAERDLRAIADLLFRTYASSEKTYEQRVTALRTDARSYQGPEAEHPRSFILRDGSRIVAHAAVLPRTINTEAGKMTILGLLRVATDTGVRGGGHGARVVRAALELVDNGTFPFGLWQTSGAVQPFYEKLGACVADNPFVDSTAEDPTVRPFKDQVVMRYPTGDDWPQGEIDLCGPGF